MKQLALLILLVSTNIFAQNKSITVLYGLSIGYDEGFSNAEGLKEYYSLAQKGASLINFELNANKQDSYFTMKDPIKNSETNFAIAFSEANTSYFTDAISTNKVKYINDVFGEFRINYTEKTDWKLENETKYIDSNLCYKATSEQILVNDKVTFRHPIIAWYCPSIPFSFGPKGYAGLPGLILELQVRNITWGATKITLTKEEKIIYKPSKGKVVSMEEYSKLLSSPEPFFR